MHSLKVYSLTFPQDKTVVPVLDWDKTGTTENWDTSILRIMHGDVLQASIRGVNIRAVGGAMIRSVMAR